MFMSTSRKKFIYLRTIFSSQHIIENNNRSFVFIYWFNFITCFINWILVGRSSYYMNWSFVTYFFKYFEQIICFAYVTRTYNDITLVFNFRNNIVVRIDNIIGFWFFYFLFFIIIFFSVYNLTILTYISIFLRIIYIYFYVANSTLSNIHLIKQKSYIKRNSYKTVNV